MWRQVRHLLSSPPAERAILWEAFLALTTAFVLVRLFPFHYLHRLLQSPVAPLTEALPHPGETRAVGAAIERVARHHPVRVTCLMQAIAATRMLARRGIPSTTLFGVRRGEAPHPDAHAWVQAGDVVVTGGTEIDSYRVIARYERKEES